MADQPTWSPPTLPPLVGMQPDFRSPLPGYIQVPEWNPGAEAAGEADIQQSTAWDRIVIAGKKLAAFVVIEGDKDTRIDVKESPGADGATATTLGVSPAPITIRLRFLTMAAFQEWVNLIPDLQPLPGKPRVDPVSVYHPALAANGIRSLYLKTLGTARISGPGGYMEVITRWLEFLPKKKVGTRTMMGAKDSHVGNTPKAPTFTKKKPSENAGP